MSIKYRLYQDNRTNSKHKGAWYARAFSPELVDMKELANRINNSCTVTHSDVIAVITALVGEMNYALREGKRVKLDSLGTFRVGIHSQGVTNAKDFNVQKHISRPHVIFTPAVSVGADRRRTPLLLTGLMVQESLVYKGSTKKKGGKKGSNPASSEGNEEHGPISAG